VGQNARTIAAEVERPQRNDKCLGCVYNIAHFAVNTSLTRLFFSLFFVLEKIRTKDFSKNLIMTLFMHIKLTLPLRCSPPVIGVFQLNYAMFNAVIDGD